MLRHRTMALAASCALVAAGAPARAGAKKGEAVPFQVDSRVALSSFMTIGDGHLQRMAVSLRALAATDQARTGDWARIEKPLAEVAKMNADALNWFALPDGSYWSVQNGREQGNLSDRAYFPAVVKGRPVLGELVTSKATGKSVGIVAVPVTGRDGAVVGVLGASIYLEKLSERIRGEMAIDEHLIFYSFDATPLLALVWDPGLVFTNPRELGPEVDRAFTEMLTKTEGTVRYTFRGKARTVVFRKSPATGWWYAFGSVKASATARK